MIFISTLWYNVCVRKWIGHKAQDINYTPTGILILSYALTPAPSLSYFNVTALEGGRSVLLEWALEFDGGPKLEEFTIKVSLLAATSQ